MNSFTENLKSKDFFLYLQKYYVLMEWMKKIVNTKRFLFYKFFSVITKKIIVSFIGLTSGITGNTKAITEIQLLPRQYQKYLEFRIAMGQLKKLK